MELYERIRYISSSQRFSLAKIADFAGVPPQTFHKWLDEKSQRNIWEHLPKIEQHLPQIRREWLWWGEGEMLKSDAPLTLPEPTPDMTAELARMRIELDEVNKINRQLVTKLLVDGVGDKDAQTNTAKTADGAK